MNDAPQSPHARRAPDLPDRSPRPRGIVTSFVFGVLILAVLLWQFAGVTNDGLQIQVLDPDLGLVWKVLIAALVAVNVACSLLVWARRSWTMPIATVNAVANGALAGVTVLLTLTDELFAPTLPAQVGAIFETNAEWNGLTEPFILIVLAVAIWDSLDGLVQARGSRIAAAGAGR